MTYLLAYFCMACLVLYFRRLCSEPPEVSRYNNDGEKWWLITFALILGWPLLAPLAGSYQLGRATRAKIEEHNASVEDKT